MHRATVFPKAAYEPKMLAFKAFDLQGLPFCNRERNPAEVSCPTRTKCAIASFRVFGFASSMPSAVSSALGLSKTNRGNWRPGFAAWGLENETGRTRGQPFWSPIYPGWLWYRL